jgi:hypothetical protein
MLTQQSVGVKRGVWLHRLSVSFADRRSHSFVVHEDALGAAFPPSTFCVRVGT